MEMVKIDSVKKHTTKDIAHTPHIYLNVKCNAENLTIFERLEGRAIPGRCAAYQNP